jgi:hypothetical protein
MEMADDSDACLDFLSRRALVEQARKAMQMIFPVHPPIIFRRSFVIVSS